MPATGSGEAIEIAFTLLQASPIQNNATESTNPETLVRNSSTKITNQTALWTLQFLLL